MNGNDDARRLLDMAERDLRALSGMLAPGVFDDSVFGFHVQQAIEKTLKAWISLLERGYPLTHDIGRLLALIEESGADVDGFRQLPPYTAFAVQFRYEYIADAEQLPAREVMIRDASALWNHVMGMVE